MVRRRPARR